MWTTADAIELPCPQRAEVHNRLVDTLGLQVGLSILNIVDQLSIGWLINNSLDGPNEMMIHILVDDSRPTFLANANQTRVRVGVHLLALEYKHFSDSLWNRRKPIIWEIVEDSKKRRQMLTLRKVWPSREQVGREFTSSPQTFPFGNNCADDCDSDDFVISVGCNMFRITKSLTSSVEQHWVWEEYWDLMQ